MICYKCERQLIKDVVFFPFEIEETQASQKFICLDCLKKLLKTKKPKSSKNTIYIKKSFYGST